MANKSDSPEYEWNCSNNNHKNIQLSHYFNGKKQSKTHKKLNENEMVSFNGLASL